VSDANRFDLWCRICRDREVRRIAEAGVWRGEFAERVLRYCPDIASYYMIDPWRPLSRWNKPFNVSASVFANVYRDAIECTAFAASKVVVLRGTTSDVASQIPDESLDLAYIDGDHTLRGITIDLLTMLRKVRSGGLIGGDDYVDEPWHHGVAYEPTLVCPFALYFAEAMNMPFVALPFQQFLILNAPIGFSFTNLSGAVRRDHVGKPESPVVRAARFTSTRVRQLFHRGP
jgi:hypothetical protein